MASDDIVLPASILDTDLYKFTMQQAVLHHFPDVQATYRFTHRDHDVLFSRECIHRFQQSVSRFGELRLSDVELEWLRNACPYFTPEYLQYLSAFRFQPSQVRIQFTPISEDGRLGHVDIQAGGLWAETILWEVPLMACLSEIYFRTVDTDWHYDGQEALAYSKGNSLLKAGCAFSEFGTRRRRSYLTHSLVLQGLVRSSRDNPSTGKLTGTSNVHFAHRLGLAPVGTIAHEWFMAIGALKGYEHANLAALTLWEQVYPNTLLLALTDTFSTEVFYRDFLGDRQLAQRWKGLRQDSGDPFIYAPRARQIYEQLGINHQEKTIIFSDALNVDKAIKLKTQCDEIGFNSVSFGIGTFLTNDFKSLSSDGVIASKALNMVIKLSSVNNLPCVKISDDLQKNTGDSQTVDLVKNILKL